LAALSAENLGSICTTQGFCGALRSASKTDMRALAVAKANKGEDISNHEKQEYK
jgi:hypothetical protein